MKKRLLCAALILGLLIPCVGFAFTDDAKIVQKDAVKLCTDLGILSGRADGNFDPSAPFTRAEMAKVLATIESGGKEPADPLHPDNRPFTDSADHWANKYILLAMEKYYISGTGPNTFSPDKAITAAEGAKMLLNLLGYRSHVEGYTESDWEKAVLKRAIEQKLIDGLTLKSSDMLCREDAAKMISNALSAKTVKYDDTVSSVGDDQIISNATLKPQTTTLKETYFK